MSTDRPAYDDQANPPLRSHQYVATPVVMTTASTPQNFSGQQNLQSPGTNDPNGTYALSFDSDGQTYMTGNYAWTALLQDLTNSENPIASVASGTVSMGAGTSPNPVFVQLQLNSLPPNWATEASPDSNLGIQWPMSMVLMFVIDFSDLAPGGPK